MLWIKYKLNVPFTMGAEMVDSFIDKALSYCDANMAIAKKEAYNGEYTIDDDGEPEAMATE